MIDLYDRLKPVGRILDLSNDGWTVWDCSPIYGPDGRVHLFSIRWKGLDQPDGIWCNASQIIHSVAEKPEGPYEIKDIVLDGDGGDHSWDASAMINPKIYQVGDQYCIYYTGCTAKKHDTQAVGVLVSSSLDGSWEKPTADPIVCPSPDRQGPDGYLCNNPAMVKHPNGQIWLYYKGRPVIGEKDGTVQAGAMNICLAIADDIRGPYLKYSLNPILEFDGKSIEDPYVWHDGTSFWMILSEIGFTQPAGTLLKSDDGLSWSVVTKAYPSPKEFLGRQQRLEEPNLLFKDGKATHLFNILGACPEDNAYSGFVFEIES